MRLRHSLFLLSTGLFSCGGCSGIGTELPDGGELPDGSTGGGSTDGGQSPFAALYRGRGVTHLAGSPTLLAYSIEMSAANTEVFVIPKAGGTPQRVLQNLSKVGALALNEAQVFARTSTGVVAASTSGGAPLVLSSGQDLGISLAFDQADVYWASNLGGTGAVRASPVAGGPVRDVLAGAGQVSCLALEGDRVYWAESSQLRSTPPSKTKTAFFAAAWQMLDQIHGRCESECAHSDHGLRG